MEKGKSKSRKTGRRSSAVEGPRDKPPSDSVLRGVIMPHVVSPEVAGGDVVAPRIVQGTSVTDMERILAREERERVLELRFQERLEEFYAKALPLVKNRRIVVRSLQRTLGIGYRQACQIVQLLEDRGVIDRM